MVGNTYPYTPRDWISDINLARTHGFDAFALNVGHEDWQRARVADAYAAALQLQTDFKLFLSFDMTSIPGASEADAEFLHQYWNSLGATPTITTFAGDQCKFGQTSITSGWAVARAALERVCPIHLIPAFFIDPAQYPWNGSWPIHLTRAPQEKNTLSCVRLRPSSRPKSTGRTYMAAHYGPDSWNKNWIYRADDWLLVRRWEHLLACRNAIDIVQFISWNDYGESHYIAPVRGAQPNSQAWVDGFPHTPWLALNAYFARAFKEGCMPPIWRDKIFVWARPHPKDAISLDHVPRPRDWELTDDKFWVVVFACAPCIALLAAGDERPRRFTCPAGVSKLSCPLRIGHGIHAKLVRDGVVVAQCHPQEYQFNAEPEVYNFNAYVEASE
ncbi:glycoside hydrolase family 71 protein [Russula vinacea]|nr:glycoside hydrolase family 71 protein [Russula vinacea]